MPIKIVHPQPGTAMDPVRLPRKFVAVGRKAAAEVPAGFLVSVDSTTHRPDGKAVIGGTSFPYKRKKQNGDLEPHPERWAMHFRLAGVKRQQRFSLVVFDALALPPVGVGGNTPIDVVRCDHLAVRRRGDGGKGEKGEKEDEKKGEKGPPVVKAIYPAPGARVYADQFVVYGDLPAGDYDVDLNATKLYKEMTNTVAAPPHWSWSDGDGFFAVFFPLVNHELYPKVDVKVFFLPSGDDEVSEGVFVDRPLP